MATMTPLGTNSNLPLEKLLDDLTAINMKRLIPMTRRQTSYKSKLTAFGVLRSTLDNIATTTAALKAANQINTTKASGNSVAFSATVDNTSVVISGNYPIAVTSLAQAQSLRTNSQTSDSALLGTTGAGTRTIRITQPGQTQPLVVTLDDVQTSLTAIRDAINKQAGHVNAMVIKGDDSHYYLSLTAKNTGTQSVMEIQVTGDEALAGILNYSATQPGNMTEAVVARDASLTINGISITRQNNTISGVPEGMTLILKSLSAVDNPEILHVARDTFPLKKAIQDFVEAYNELQTISKAMTFYQPVEPAKQQSPDNGALLGDSTLRILQTQLRNSLNIMKSGKNGQGINSLIDIGVNFNRLGNLEIDARKLEQAASSKSNQIVDFLVGDGKKTGFATQIDKILTAALNTRNGTLKSATDSIDRQIKAIDVQIADTTRRIETEMAAMRRQFINLDMLVTKLNKTSEILKRKFSSTRQKPND